MVNAMDGVEAVRYSMGIIGPATCIHPAAYVRISYQIPNIGQSCLLAELSALQVCPPPRSNTLMSFRLRKTAL